LQTEPILPEGYGLMKAIGALLGVLQDAFELRRALERKYGRLMQSDI